MRQCCLPSPVPCLPAECPDRFHAALVVLLQGIEYASEMECDLWQFAVEVAQLRAAGLTNADLRWLECSGFVDHAVEKTQAGNPQRVFRPAANLALVATSCFVLCPAAIARAGRCSRKRSSTWAGLPSSAASRR